MQQIKKNIGFKGDIINEGLSNNSNSYYCNDLSNSMKQLAFKMVYRDHLNWYLLKSDCISCSEIIFFIVYAVHPLYPPPAGDIARFPLPAGDITICFSTGGGYRYQFSQRAGDIAISPAGGGLRGWSKLFPLYNFQQLAFKIVYRNCLNRYHLKPNRGSCSEIILLKFHTII